MFTHTCGICLHWWPTAFNTCQTNWKSNSKSTHHNLLSLKRKKCNENHINSNLWLMTLSTTRCRKTKINLKSFPDSWCSFRRSVFACQWPVTFTVTFTAFGVITCLTLLPIFYQQFAVTNTKRRPGTFTWFGVTNIERVWKKEGAEVKHCNNHNLWGCCVWFSETPKTFYVFPKWLLGFIFVFLFIITIDNIVWWPNIRCTCWDEPMTAGACNWVIAPIIILTLQVQRCKCDDGNIQSSHCSNYYPSTVHISMQLSLSIVQQPL